MYNILCPADNKEYTWNINNVYVCINMLGIEKLVLSYNNRHQIS